MATIVVDGVTYTLIAGVKNIVADPAGVTKVLTHDGQIASLGGGSASSPLTVKFTTGVLGAPATTVSLTGLDGNADERYMIDMMLVSGSATNGTVELRPNASTTTVGYSADGEDSTGVAGTPAAEASNVKATVGWIGGGAAQDRTLIVVDCWVKSGGGRIFSFRSRMYRLTAVALWRNTQGFANWGDTAANITSIDVVAQQANGIGTGSIITVYKLARA